MPRVERTIRVDQPVEKVWAYLSDFTTTEEWDPPTKSTVRTSGDGGVGTTYRNVSSILGSDQEVIYTVTEFVERQRLQLEGDAGKSLKLRDTITFEPAGTGTTVTYHAEFDLQGVAKLTTPLLPPALNLLANRVADSMKKTLAAL
ncbi:MAG: Polyketide cyclase / dehydrase and lipid transport [Marmoricola sp.]|nr:Polyketide cyclase / dehydrase and lipid transport [Marmoricola sp.]